MVSPQGHWLGTFDWSIVTYWNEIVAANVQDTKSQPVSYPRSHMSILPLTRHHWNQWSILGPRHIKMNRRRLAQFEFTSSFSVLALCHVVLMDAVLGILALAVQ